MVLMNSLSSCSLLWRLLAMLAKVVRRNTASDVKVFSSMSVNWALWVGSGGVVYRRNYTHREKKFHTTFINVLKLKWAIFIKI